MQSEEFVSVAIERPAATTRTAGPVWRVISQASEKGSAAYNEDIAGAAGACAWIVDGSAFFTGAARTTTESEGAWLVRRIDEILRTNPPEDIAFPDWAAALEQQLRLDYATLGQGHPEREAGEGPSAVLGLARLVGGGQACRIEAAVIGDVSILIQDGDRIERWTDPSSNPFEARTIAAATEDGHLPGEVISPKALAQILRNRRSLNRPGGYWAINPGLSWTQGLRLFSGSISPTATVLLASDGFMRLVDVIAHHDDRGLMDAVKRVGTNGVIAELRQLESADPQAERYRRVKIHDDATALVVSPELHGNAIEKSS
uniref:Protein phosphatase 2C domain-containing protein n=1 Tax=Bosea sp. NBC_00436 TaxID=2969620 RepID=A0A9E7ZKC5_9HYPH